MKIVTHVMSAKGSSAKVWLYLIFWFMNSLGVCNETLI